ncbi:MAG: hypothetical protein SNJ78_10790 [Spirochaetales bacterium]
MDFAKGKVYNVTKFFFISFANGLYLATHNTLRGFDKKVVRGNFFRSVFAWPLAAVFAPVGDLLGVPSIVQAKFWSDVVAGLIEGGSKYVKLLKVQKRDLSEILPRVGEEKEEDRYAAILDLLQLFRDQPRTRNTLRKIFLADKTGSFYTLLAQVLRDPGLYTALIDYILEQLPQDVSADLILLLGGAFPEFRNWIFSVEKDITPATKPVLVVGR